MNFEKFWMKKDYLKKNLINKTVQIKEILTQKSIKITKLHTPSNGLDFVSNGQT